MKVKLLAEGRYEVVGVMKGDSCPAEEFLTQGEASTFSARQGLYQMLQAVAERGLADIPRQWCHEANKQAQVYEFIKGPLRMFFFKGAGSQIAVCTGGIRKAGKKADPKSVQTAKSMRSAYQEAVQANTLEVVSDAEDQ